MKGLWALATAVMLGATPLAATDWKSDGPSAAGWRTVRRDMTVEELLRAMPGETVRGKDQKHKEGPIHRQAKVTKKVPIAGLDYEVTFYFDAKERLDWMTFVCNKTKPLSFESVTNDFTEVFGEPSDVSRQVYSNGETTTMAWIREGVTYYVSAVGSRLNLLMTARFVTVSVVYK
jgi:hypothetical protein